MSKIGASELIINPDGSVFHLHLKPEDIADDILLVGDPGRVELISSFFDTKEFVKSSREFVTCTGSYKGKRITALSTGIGTDNIDIVVTELDALANVDFATREVKEKKRSLRLLRIGTCGGVQPDVPLGSYIFSRRSIGMDGLLNWYADRDKYSQKDVEQSFIKHMGWNEYLPVPYVANADDALYRLFEDVVVPGITISASGFYGPQGRVLRMGLAIPHFISKLASFRFGNERITNIEMEGSALAGLGGALGHRAGTVCLLIADRNHKESNPDYKPLMNNLVKIVLDRFSKTE